MNWRGSLIGVAVALPILSLLAFGLTRDPKAMSSPLPGRAAPEFRLAMMDSPADTVRLAQHLGEIVVLNFWASWCLECRREHASLSQAADIYRDRGVHFYGVLYNDSPENGRRYIQQLGGQSYPALLDPNSRTAIDYGLYGVPETFFIGRDGRVVHKQIGPLTLSKIMEIINPLLAESPEGEAAETAAETAGAAPGTETPQAQEAST
jgi:cytochrome c biogenesis protein CcmG, thiol:disulfide interchange protein DsbE